MAQYNNKIIYNGQVLIDLTGDDITPEKLTKGAKGHDKTGAPIVGTNDFDSNTQDANTTDEDVVQGKIYYALGRRGTGAMPVNGAVQGKISNKDTPYIVPRGNHDGSGQVTIADEEKAKLVPDNIRQGITILGVEGAMSGLEDVKAQAKSVTPTGSQQVITPDEGFNYLSQVTVEPIPYSTQENAAGGMTVTIGSAG